MRLSKETFHLSTRDAIYLILVCIFIIVVNVAPSLIRSRYPIPYYTFVTVISFKKILGLTIIVGLLIS
jgi:hypothetical protein